MSTDALSHTVNASEREAQNRQEFQRLYANQPLPDSEIMSNLMLFTKRQDLSRFLFFHHLYQKIIHQHGVILEFGVRWGKDLAMLINLRGIFEPFNHNRKIIGFDTFEGFPSVHSKDGRDDMVKAGSLSVTDDYEKHLESILTYHEQESPIQHMKKFEIVKGDVTETIHKYFDENPQTIVSMAYFDLDLYEPTLDCLNVIKKHSSRGTVLGFDEVNVGQYPGETAALMEALDLSQYALQRTPYSSAQSYLTL